MTSTSTVGTRASVVTQLQQQVVQPRPATVAKAPSAAPVAKQPGSSFQAARAATVSAPRPKPLGVGASGPQVRTLQTRLQALGFYNSTIDGQFGPMTKAAVQAFERKHGWKPDGIAGARLQETLAKEVKALPTPNWKTVRPPPEDYRVINYRGVKVNVRTRVLIERAESYMKKMGLTSKLVITQGSFSSGVSASAGTHDGGGALDISVRGFSAANADKVVKAMRMAGFAAWRRGVNDSFTPHIHAIAIGDKRATQVAKNQVAEYFRGGDGLVGSRGDMHLTSLGHNIGRPVPNWAK